jgi:hypothetical protein
LIRERIGFNSNCVCLDCLCKFRADLGSAEEYWSPYEPFIFRPKRVKDKRECAKCKSVNVRAEIEMIGESYPKCKQGMIEEIWTECVA